MPHNEAEIEAQIVAAGKTAPRLTPQLIDDKIAKREFWQPKGTSVTVCLITLVNGYTVEGYSASASVENFDKEIGERIAFENARQKIWPLEGYLLRQRLFEESDIG